MDSKDLDSIKSSIDSVVSTMGQAVATFNLDYEVWEDIKDQAEEGLLESIKVATLHTPEVLSSPAFQHTVMKFALMIDMIENLQASIHEYSIQAISKGD